LTPGSGVSCAGPGATAGVAGAGDAGAARFTGLSISRESFSWGSGSSPSAALVAVANVAPMDAISRDSEKERDLMNAATTSLLK
jgi:hypothetical protein